MSFQDLASGGGGGGGRVVAKPQQQQQQDNPMQAIASGLFQITTAMSRFQRHVHTLGTPQDTPQLRAKLRKTSSHIQYLMDETKAKLDQANWRVLSDPGKKLAIARFEKDYHAVLKQFLNVQHLAYQREETLAAAAAAAALLPLSTYPDDNKPPAPDVVLVFDNEVAFNEALIEEREEEIKVVQQQIADLSETFREVAILVQQQGEMIDVVETNIVSSHEATTQAKSQLLEASTTQETDSSCNCLLLVILGVVLIIVIILIMA